MLIWAYRKLVMLKIFICLICLIFGPYPLYADQETPLGVSFYGSFLFTEEIPNTLFFFSDIEENDSFQLRRALRNHDIDTVVLSSNGGSVWEGLNMAGIIFDKGLKTYIPKKGLQHEGDCASACSFMFFAGRSRVADGRLGVHQFYSDTAKESAEIGNTQKIAQFTVSEIIGFLNEFSTPPFVYERMFQQQRMYYFNQKELEEITRIGDPITDIQIDKISNFIEAFNIELAKMIEEDEADIVDKQEPNPKKPNVLPKKETITEISEVQIIKGIQIELNRLNCLPGSADGVIGNQTRSALKRYALIKGQPINEALLKDQDFLLELRRSNTQCELAPRNLVCFGNQGRSGKAYGLTKVIIYNFTKSPKPITNADPKVPSKVKIKYCTIPDPDPTFSFPNVFKNGCTTDSFEKVHDWGDRWDFLSFSSRNIEFKKLGRTEPFFRFTYYYQESSLDPPIDRFWGEYIRGKNLWGSPQTATNALEDCELQ